MYIDPAFGGMLIQIVIAMVVAGGAIAFGMRKKIAMFFNKKKNGQQTGVAGGPAHAGTNTGDGADVIDVLSDND